MREYPPDVGFDESLYVLRGLYRPERQGRRPLLPPACLTVLTVPPREPTEAVGALSDPAFARRANALLPN